MLELRHAAAGISLRRIATLREIWRRRSESNRRRRLCRPLHDHSATPPGARAADSFGGPGKNRKLLSFYSEAIGLPKEKGKRSGFPLETGAGDESRTRDLNLGKVALYQLSYSRIN